jgi:hypothetical protein
MLSGQLEFPITYADERGGRKAMKMFTNKDFWIRMPTGGLVQLKFTDEKALIANQNLTNDEVEALESFPFLLIEGEVRGGIYVFCIPNGLNPKVQPYEILVMGCSKPIEFLGIRLGFKPCDNKAYYIKNGPRHRPFHLIRKSAYSGEYGWSSEDAHQTNYNHVRIRSSFE